MIHNIDIRSGGFTVDQVDSEECLTEGDTELTVDCADDFRIELGEASENGDYHLEWLFTAITLNADEVRELLLAATVWLEKHG